MSVILNKYKMIVIGIILFILYTLIRLYHLTFLPLFTDEAIYIRWAQIASYDPNWRFISLTDGKQPLYVWIMMISVRIFSDPLFAGRIISVISGFFSMIGCGFLAWYIFRDKRIGIVASFFYLFTPFFVMYDRLALMDGFLTMFFIWSFFLAVITVRKMRLDSALLFGMAAGGALLTKTSGFFIYYLSPFLLLLFPKKNIKGDSTYWVKIIAYMCIAFIISMLFYAILRLSPWFNMIAQKDATFVELPPVSLSLFFTDFHMFYTSISEWFWYRTRFFVGNIKALHEWMRDYLTIPVYFLVLISVFYISKKTRQKLFLLLWGILPMIALAFTGKVLYPRFILFTMPAFILLASWTLIYLVDKTKKHLMLTYFIYIIFFFYPIFVDLKIIGSILTAPIPRADYNQYVNGIFSGWGIPEVNDIIQKKSEVNHITVFTDGTFGLLPYGIEIYQRENHNVTIKGIYPLPKTYTHEMLEAFNEGEVYFVANQNQKLPSKWKGEIIGAWRKGVRTDKYMKIYILFPSISID